MGYIMNLKRIGRKIIKLFRWHAGLAERGLGRCELSLRVELFEQVPNGIEFLCIKVLLKEWHLWSEITYIAVTLIADGPYAEYRFITAVARPKSKTAIWFSLLTNKIAVLHVFGLIQPGYIHQGGGRSIASIKRLSTIPRLF